MAPQKSFKPGYRLPFAPAAAGLGPWSFLSLSLVDGPRVGTMFVTFCFPLSLGSWGPCVNVFGPFLYAPPF